MYKEWKISGKFHIDTNSKPTTNNISRIRASKAQNNLLFKHIIQFVSFICLCISLVLYV